MEEKLEKLIKDRESKLKAIKELRGRNFDATVQEVTKAWIMDLNFQIKELGEILEQCKSNCNQHFVSDSVNCQHPFSKITDKGPGLNYCSVCDKFL